MEKKELDVLKAILAADVADYAKCQSNLTEEEKAKRIMILNKESSTINDVERTESDKEDKKSRALAETRRQKLETRKQDSRWNQEFTQRSDELEQKKQEFDLEKQKLEQEKSESEKARIDKRVDTAVHIVEIVAPLVVYSALMLLNFKLVYKDRGLEPSEMKDLFKNITR